MTTAPVAPCINEALPEEVFGVIFEEHAKLEWKAPIIDGQVCRHWRETVLRSPRAWSHIKIGQNFASAPSKLQDWLDRSGSAPLHIQALDGIEGGGEVLDQHRKRIESMSLHDHHLTLLENRSFPILQSLTLVAWGSDTPLIRWSAHRSMPELRYLQTSYISMDALPLNIFPRLRVLVLYAVKDCNFIIQNSYHSLTSLMLDHVSFQYTSEFLEFPSLRFLSLCNVRNLKHRMNIPALTTYHEEDLIEEESFPMSLPSLIEYGLYRLSNGSPLNVTKLHQCYPNISRLSLRACPSDVKLLLHSLSRQPTTLPMLRILAVENLMIYSREHKDSMMNDVFMRNMASSVKMELCLGGKARLPLYFGVVRVYINAG